MARKRQGNRIDDTPTGAVDSTMLPELDRRRFLGTGAGVLLAGVSSFATFGAMAQGSSPDQFTTDFSEYAL